MSTSDMFTLSVNRGMFRTEDASPKGDSVKKVGSSLLLPIQSRKSNLHAECPRGVSIDSTVASPSISLLSESITDDIVGSASVFDASPVFGRLPDCVQKSVRWTQLSSVSLVDAGNSTTGSPLANHIAEFVDRITGETSPKCVDTIYVYESNDVISESEEDEYTHKSKDSTRSSFCWVY